MENNCNHNNKVLDDMEKFNDSELLQDQKDIGSSPNANIAEDARSFTEHQYNANI